MKEHKVEIVSIDSLKPHPRNYREHPDDQLAHLVESLKRFGVYRNVVVAKDGTVLAGHGVVEAAKRSKLYRIPVIRLNVDPSSPDAIRVLVGDNEIEHLAEQNDRLLADLLKELKKDEGLLGTGFDEMMLATFAMVTRPESEIANMDEASQWVGMPRFMVGKEPLKIVVAFRNKKDREKFARKLGVVLTEKTRGMWYPPQKTKDDISSVKVKG